MKNLKGQVRRLYADAVRDDLKHYARAADESARKTEQYATALALEAERLNGTGDRGDRSPEMTAARYDARDDGAGNRLLIKVDPCETGAFLSLAIGCRRVAVTPDVVRQLGIYEQAVPRMMRMYDEVENIDGVFLFDTRSNILLFRTEYEFAHDFYGLAGTDVKGICEMGLTFYDWFEFVDRRANPDRRARWSAMAFIAVEHDWIMHLKAPIYDHRYAADEEMIGLVGIHYNLDWLCRNTIAKNSVRMMIVKDDSTLVGLNDAARKDIGLEAYDKSNWMSLNAFDPATTQKKKTFVYETLNLDRGKGRDVASFSSRLKSEFRFEQALFGKTYTVLRERAPELGLNFLALLESD